MSLDRRDFLAATGGAVVGLGGVVFGGRCAQARAPVSKSQVPGCYRFSLGQFQVTVVSDGTIAFPAEVLWPEASKADRDAVLLSDFQPTDKSTLQVNVLAVNTGDRLVLIDAGSPGKDAADRGPSTPEPRGRRDQAGGGRHNSDHACPSGSPVGGR